MLRQRRLTDLIPGVVVRSLRPARDLGDLLREGIEVDVQFRLAGAEVVELPTELRIQRVDALQERLKVKRRLRGAKVGFRGSGSEARSSGSEARSSGSETRRSGSEARRSGSVVEY